MGEVVALDAYRRRQRDTIPSPPPTEPPSAAPLVELAAYDDAVQLVLGECEVWITPAQARELGRELLEVADDADGGRRG